MLDNRFLLARAPPGFAGGVWAPGFPGGGLEARRPLALLGAPWDPEPPPSAPPTRGRLVRARAAEPSSGGAVLGTPGTPRRPGTPAPRASTRRGGAATYQLLRVSLGAPGPHQRCSQVLKLLPKCWNSDPPPPPPTLYFLGVRF